MTTTTEVMGLAIIAGSLVPLLLVYVIRRKTLEISIDSSPTKEDIPRLSPRRRSARLILALWAFMVFLHVMFLEIGAYIALGFEGAIVVLIYAGPFLILAAADTRNLKLEPLERIELALEEVQAIHTGRIDVLRKNVEYLIRNSAYNERQRTALMRHLAKRQDTIGQIASELLDFQ